MWQVPWLTRIFTGFDKILGEIMDNVRRPFTVSLIAPPDPRFHSYDTTIWAGSLPDAHTVALSIMSGHNAQNRGFWSGWCFEIKDV